VEEHTASTPPVPAAGARKSPTEEQAPQLSVIGIGASAGGLKPICAFLSALPPDTEMTFIVITQLSPQQENILAELLQPHTEMPVQQVSERIKMEPNQVYVIPPGKRVLVMAGHLDLTEFDMPRGQRLQIDTFFRSLAEHHGDGGAVILSGSGSDGAVGIQSIKEKGGLLLVQDPTEAEYDGMPKSAIATGLVDIVAPVAQLATRLMAAKRAGAALELPTDPNELSSTAEDTLAHLLAHLRLRTGHDFSGYKRATILRRIGRRMQVTQLPTLTAYLHRIRQDGEEVNILNRDLLIHVTEFFRDPAAWEVLAQEIVPRIFSGKGRDDTVRVWTVGCATGEEAYGIGMLLLEHAGTLSQPPQIQIFASDLGELALDYARRGIYPQAIAANVSAERLGRFFLEENSHYRVRDELRERVLFTAHNLLQDPPFSKLDLILCRNLLIYMQRPLQERVFATFHYALRPEGHLFLGSAESLDSITTLFDAVNKQHRIYRRNRPGTLVLPALPSQPPSTSPALPQRQPPATEPLPKAEAGNSWLMEAIAPPNLLVDANYTVRQLSKTAGRYLQHPAGSPTTEALRLVRTELQAELRAALFRAIEYGNTTLTRPVPVRFNGAPHPVVMFVRPLPSGIGPAQALVFFLEDETPLGEGAPAGASTEGPSVQQMQTELGQAERQLQTLREQYETTVEELRSANEELQSTNAEYRSTLEELETSKEELQSINEELQTVNLELRSKVAETAQTNNDLHNLFAATEIATLFLDRELKIKRYTPRAADLFNLMPPDQGRPISHLRTNLDYPGLVEDARRGLQQLTPIEREVQDTAGHWYQVNVRPYRTPEDHINGVVITFVDVTTNKQNELALQAAKAYAESIVRTIPDALLVMDTNLRVQTANDSFYTTFQVEPAATEGRLVYELGNNQWDIPELRTLLENILPENHVFVGYEVDHEFDTIGRRTMLLNGRQLDHAQLILLAITDITARKQAEEALWASEEPYRLLVESAREYAIFLLDLQGRITTWNTGAERVFGYPEPEVIGMSLATLFTAEDRAAGVPAAELATATRTGQASDDRWQQRKDGSRFWANGVTEALYQADGQLYAFVKVLRDNTQQKQDEEALEAQVAERTQQVRELVRQLSLSEQEERQRISQVLHDDLQQHLYGVQYQLVLLQEALGATMAAQAATWLTAMAQELQTATQLTRNLSIDLSPPVLEGEGLDGALVWLATQMKQQHGLTVKIQAADKLPVPAREMRVLLFQILREILFNIVKHAEVQEATIILTDIDHHIEAQVIDHGQGFDVDAVLHEPGRSHGLLRNQQRLELVGGHMRIESSPAGGTHVIISCPLAQTEALTPDQPSS